MIKDAIESITTAARKLFTNWGALLISLLLYAALIAVSYLFVTTREATWFQVSLSLVILPVAAIALFFALQAMGLSYVRIGVGPIYLLKRALKDCWRLLLVSLPVFLIGGLVVYFIGGPDPKWMSGWLNQAPGRARIAAAAWYLLFCFALPLAAVHLWIIAAREGVAAGFRGFFRGLARAFSPRSVLIYLLVTVVFSTIVWLLLSPRTHLKSEWGELWLVGARVSLALALVLVGWLILLGAMAEMTARKAMSEIEV